MSHWGEGKAVLVISQFSHNLSVSLSNYYSAKNPKLTQVEHTCSLPKVGRAFRIFSPAVACWRLALLRSKPYKVPSQSQCLLKTYSFRFCPITRNRWVKVPADATHGTSEGLNWWHVGDVTTKKSKNPVSNRHRNRALNSPWCQSYCRPYHWRLYIFSNSPAWWRNNIRVLSACRS